MKLTLNGALDLSKAINAQTIWNKRSNDFFNNLALELKNDALDALENKPSPRSQAGRGNKNTGATRRSVFVAKLGNTNRLRMSEGFKLATNVPYAPFIHGKPIFRSFTPVKRTKPFFPPYHKGSSLYKWARRGTPKMNAFLVAKKISKTGLKMKPFIGGVVYEKQKEIQEGAENMLKLIAQDIARSVK
jgi:hypothetical protein